MPFSLDLSELETTVLCLIHCCSTFLLIAFIWNPISLKIKIKNVFARIIFNIILTLDFKPPVIQGKKPCGTVPDGEKTLLLTVGKEPLVL